MRYVCVTVREDMRQTVGGMNLVELRVRVGERVVNRGSIQQSARSRAGSIVSRGTPPTKLSLKKLRNSRSTLRIYESTTHGGRGDGRINIKYNMNRGRMGDRIGWDSRLGSTWSTYGRSDINGSGRILGIIARWQASALVGCQRASGDIAEPRTTPPMGCMIRFPAV